MSTTIANTTIYYADSGLRSHPEFVRETEEYIHQMLIDNKFDGFFPLLLLTKKPNFDLPTAYADLLDKHLRAFIADTVRDIPVDAAPDHYRIVTFVNAFTEQHLPILVWHTKNLNAFHTEFLIKTLQLPEKQPETHQSVGIVNITDTEDRDAIIANFSGLTYLASTLQLVVEHARIHLYLVPNAQKSWIFRAHREKLLLDAHASLMYDVLIKTINTLLFTHVKSGSLDQALITPPPEHPQAKTIKDLRACLDDKSIIGRMPLKFKINLLRQKTNAMTFYTYANPGKGSAGVPSYYPEIPQDALPLARLLRGVLDHKTKESHPEKLAGGKTSMQILASKLPQGMALYHLKSNSIQITF